MNGFTKAFVLSAACVLAGTGASIAEHIKLAAGSSHPPFLPWVEAITKHVVPETNKRLEAMGSDNRIERTKAYAESLLNALNALEGMESGLADLARIGTIFEPAKLPHHNVHFYAPFAVSGVRDLTEIGNRLHSNVPAMDEQWAKCNQVHLGAMTDGSYHLITKKPINTLDGLYGLKLLAGGAFAN
ncbi:MAG: hypothetical protein OXN84_04505 [Albidovulum sp.]|nr:hypothetical protein [Albidovulum sp.]